MRASVPRCEELFHSALGLEDAARGRVSAGGLCDDPTLRAEVERLLGRARPGGRLHRGAGGALGRRAGPRRGGCDRPPDRAVSRRPGDRTRRDGRRLPRRAGRRPVQQRVAHQADQARDGHRPGAGPVPGRASDPGLAGPPQHRPAARRRQHRRRACRTSRWSTSRAQPIDEYADARGSRRGAAAAVPAGVRRGGLRPPAPGRPPRHQAARTSW